MSEILDSFCTITQDALNMLHAAHIHPTREKDYVQPVDGAWSRRYELYSIPWPETIQVKKARTDYVRVSLPNGVIGLFATPGMPVMVDVLTIGVSLVH
jgi:hypothetical protein